MEKQLMNINNLITEIESVKKTEGKLLQVIKKNKTFKKSF